VTDELQLPQASLLRITKAALPEGVIVAKESRQAIQLSAKVFLHYVTAW
jgi:hypothetical protein